MAVVVVVVGRALRLPGVDVGRRGDLIDQAALLLRLAALLRGCAGRLARDGIEAKSIRDDNWRFLRNRLTGGAARGLGRTRALFVLAALRAEQQRTKSKGVNQPGKEGADPTKAPTANPTADATKVPTANPTADAHEWWVLCVLGENYISN